MLSALFDQYSAESRATKISAKRASARGLPDSRTTASANSLREAIIRSRRSQSFAHRSRMDNFAHAPWAVRARETISGNRAAGVLPKCASTSPVAGLIEGSVSIGMAVAAINGILTDFEAGMWNRRPQNFCPRKRPRATKSRLRRQSFRRDRGRFALPDSANGEPVKHLIIADDRDILDLCLGNEHAVKRIFVRAFQEPGSNSMGRRDRVLHEAILRQYGMKTGYYASSIELP